VNVKRVHRLWRSEGLQVRAHHPRKRAGESSIPPVAADAPKVVWALGFQFESTVDGRAVKIASMIDEHTRESLLYLTERSIIGEHLVTELERVFAVHGTEGAAAGQQFGNDFRSAAEVLRGQGGYLVYPAGARLGPMVTSNRSTSACAWSA
jgi:transposase InsO family protein